MASLRFKKDGTPFVDFRAHGKRHRPEFTNRRDAQKFLILADADPLEAYDYWLENLKPKEAETRAGYMSLSEKIESFKENYCKKRTSGNDMQTVMDALFDFVTKKHGVTDLDVRELIFEDLEDFQTHLKQKGLKKKKAISNASVNRYFSTIKTFFKRQFKARYIPVDISALIESLPVEAVQRKAWLDESTLKMIEALEKRAKDFVLIDIVRSNEWTPFGPKDYARLTWSNIDLRRSEVRTKRMKGKGKRDWQVPILPGYLEILKGIRRRHKAAGFGADADYVYMTDDFRPINPGWVSKALERQRKALGIKEVPYSSRHRIISLLAKKTDRDTASKFAGHASIRTTEKYYLIPDDKDLKKKIRKAFKGNGH